MQKHLFFYECSKTGKSFNQMADENDWPIVILTFHRTETKRVLGELTYPKLDKVPVTIEESDSLVFECISLFAAHEIQKKFGFFREDNPRFDSSRVEYRERTIGETIAGRERLKLSKGMGNPYKNPKIIV